jgi:lipid A 4'-phosphatase
MEYLKLRRSQVILASFLAFAVLAIAFPAIDIAISRLFFDGKTFLKDQWWQKLLQDGLGYFFVLAMLAVLSIYAFNRLLNLNLFGVCGRKVLFLLLVLVIRPRPHRQLTFKDHFGRARPRDVVEFGGSKHFSPAFTVAVNAAPIVRFRRAMQPAPSLRSRWHWR